MNFVVVEDCGIEETVHTIPTLSDEKANNIEGKITLEEATRAHKNTKNNKSPGTDGFTSEFFQVFWKHLGYFVVRSLSDGFDKSDSSATQKEYVFQ